MEIHFKGCKGNFGVSIKLALLLRGAGGIVTI